MFLYSRHLFRENKAKIGDFTIWTIIVIDGICVLLAYVQTVFIASILRLQKVCISLELYVVPRKQGDGPDISGRKGRNEREAACLMFSCVMSHWRGTTWINLKAMKLCYAKTNKGHTI